MKSLLQAQQTLSLQMTHFLQVVGLNKFLCRIKRPTNEHDKNTDTERFAIAFFATIGQFTDMELRPLILLSGPLPKITVASAWQVLGRILDLLHQFPQEQQQ